MAGGKGTPHKIPKATGITVNTSLYGSVIPVIYGRTRVAGRLIWVGNFQSHQSSIGKKGGGGK
jgi:hypothetical protein